MLQFRFFMLQLNSTLCLKHTLHLYCHSFKSAFSISGSLMNLPTGMLILYFNNCSIVLDILQVQKPNVCK